MPSILKRHRLNLCRSDLRDRLAIINTHILLNLSRAEVTNMLAAHPLRLVHRKRREEVADGDGAVEAEDIFASL